MKHIKTFNLFENYDFSIYDFKKYDNSYPLMSIQEETIDQLAINFNNSDKESIINIIDKSDDIFELNDLDSKIHFVINDTSFMTCYLGDHCYSLSEFDMSDSEYISIEVFDQIDDLLICIENIITNANKY